MTHERPECEPNRETRKLSPTWGTCIPLSAGVSWYGYTHYLIRCWNCGLNAFSLFNWLLNGILVALYISFLSGEKKSRRPEWLVSESGDDAP